VAAYVSSYQVTTTECIELGCCCIIIIIIIIISFIQGIYTYIPATNHVSREYSVAAIL
jgi:hypothetical protein